MTASGGELKLVSPADTYIYEFDWTPDGKGFAATGAKGNGDNNWWVATLDYVDARNRRAARDRGAADADRACRACRATARSVAFIGGLMSDWGSIGGDVYIVPLAGGTPVNLTPEFKGTFRGIAWRGADLITSGAGR